MKRKTQLDRFWAKVDKSGDCWIWKGGVFSHGYGAHSFKSRPMLAHRVSYILTYGIIPEGMFVCHKCDTPLCVRPDHLWVGTAKDNSDDMISKKRQRHPGVCGERNGRSKLTEAQALEIFNDDRPLKEVAEDYGINYRTVSEIRRKYRWGHLHA